MNNLEKVKKIYDLIVLYEKQYGRRVSFETFEVSNNDIPIESLDDFLEVLEQNK